MSRAKLVIFLRSEFGYDVVQDDARALVRVEVKRRGATLEAHVSAQDAEGNEQWPAVIPTPLDCRELMQDAALSIAMNLGRWKERKKPVPRWLLYKEPPEITIGSPAKPAPVRALISLLPPALPARVGAASPAWSEPKEPKSELQLEAGASAFVVPYGLPGVGFGGGVFVTARWPFISAAVEMRGLSTLDVDLSGVPTQTTLWSGHTALCLNLRDRVDLCGAFSGGRLSASWDAPVQRQDAISMILMAGGRLSVMPYRLPGPVILRLFGEAMVPLGRSLIEISSRVTWEIPGAFLTLGITGSIDPRGTPEK
jgi:hypothetical protein